MIITVIWQDHLSNGPGDFNVQELEIDSASVPEATIMVGLAMLKQGYTNVEINTAMERGYNLAGIIIGEVTWLM